MAITNAEFLRGFYKKYPWKRTLNCIESRCTDETNDSYTSYGGRGIKCKITAEELKELWFRDKAYEMEKPTIDRLNPDGDYEFSNCRYLERRLNVRRRQPRKLSYKYPHEYVKRLEPLTKSEIKDIREKYATGNLGYKKLSKIYGKSPNAIRLIIKRIKP